mgnify:CR=1 FL=1
MSEFINENPDVLDFSQLPTRKIDDAENKLLHSIDITPNLASCSQWKKLKNIITDDESTIFKVFNTTSALLSLQNDIAKRANEQDDIIVDGTAEKQHNSLDYSNKTLKIDKADPGADLLDSQEIYDLIAHISDPEHPLTLGQLSVVNLQDIEVINHSSEETKMGEVVVKITPTITHCSLATLIGLGIRVRLERSLSPRFRITILLKKGTHQSENQVNKQLNDKERVAAACENDQLLGVISKMLSTCK